MEFMRVRNWDKYQHYKKRNPPWVKLYSSVLDDYDYSCLQDASKLLFILLPLLAARTNNRIPADPRWLQHKLCLSEVPDLEPLFAMRFIELLDASNTLASCKQVATPETETETEQRRGETDRDIQTEAQKRLRQEARRLAMGSRIP